MYTPITFLSIALGITSAAPVTENSNIVANKDATAAAVSVAAVSSSATAACTPSPTPDPAFFAKLASAPTAVDRQALLTDSDFIFDFDDACRTTGETNGKGGHTVRADRATFPALYSQGASVTIGFLGPCGFNTPHVHPRAAELNLVVEGTLFASVTAENGARHMNHTLKKWQMTVFPAGAVHTEYNPDCTPATFVASFPNEDPGVGQIAQEYFGLENDIIKASAGGELSIEGANIDAFRKAIPANVALGVDACLAKCGIAKR